MASQSSHALQTWWETVVESSDPKVLEFWGVCLVQLLSFWLLCLFLYLFDTLLPAVSQRLKLKQSPDHDAVSRVTIRQCLGNLLRNQLITAVLQVGYISLFHDVFGLPSIFRIDPALPSWTEIIRSLIPCYVIREMMFYHVHRLFHHPRIYPQIHKAHHDFTTPIPLAALYAHPVEHVFLFLLPSILGPMLLRIHILSFFLFGSLIIVHAVLVHTGYKYIGFICPGVSAHDDHHRYFKGNYSASLGSLDWLHGTALRFQEDHRGVGARKAQGVKHVADKEPI